VTSQNLSSFVCGDLKVIKPDSLILVQKLTSLPVLLTLWKHSAYAFTDSGFEEKLKVVRLRISK